MAKIQVKDISVSVVKVNNDDYICLTDMLKAKDGEFFFSNWLRNRNTVEFLGIREKLNNPNFNCAEFDIFKSMAGLNSYRLSAKEWMQKTNAIGIISKAGRLWKETNNNFQIPMRVLNSWEQLISDWAKDTSMPLIIEREVQEGRNLNILLAEKS